MLYHPSLLVTKAPCSFTVWYCGVLNVTKCLGNIYITDLYGSNLFKVLETINCTFLKKGDEYDWIPKSISFWSKVKKLPISNLICDNDVIAALFTNTVGTSAQL